MVEVAASQQTLRNENKMPVDLEGEGVAGLVERLIQSPPVEMWLQEYSKKGQEERFCLLLIRILEHDPAKGFALARAHKNFFNNPDKRKMFIVLLTNNSYFYWKHIPKWLDKFQTQLENISSFKTQEIQDEIGLLANPQIYVDPLQPANTSAAIPYYDFTTQTVQPTPQNRIWINAFADKDQPDSLAARILELDLFYAARRTDFDSQSAVDTQGELRPTSPIKYSVDPVVAVEEAGNEFAGLLQAQVARHLRRWREAEAAGNPFSLADKKLQLQLIQSPIRRRLERARITLVSDIASQLKPGQRIVEPGGVLIPAEDEDDVVFNELGRTVIVDADNTIIELEPESERSPIIQSVMSLKEELPANAENVSEIDVTPRGPIITYSTPDGKKYLYIEGHTVETNPGYFVSESDVKVKTRDHTVVVVPRDSVQQQMYMVSDEGLETFLFRSDRLAFLTNGVDWIGWTEQVNDEAGGSEFFLNGRVYQVPEFADFRGKKYDANIDGNTAYITFESDDPDEAHAVYVLNFSTSQIYLSPVEKKSGEYWDFMTIQGVSYAFDFAGVAYRIRNLSSGEVLTIPGVPVDAEGFFELQGSYELKIDKRTGHNTPCLVLNNAERTTFMLRDGKMVEVDQDEALDEVLLFHVNGELMSATTELANSNEYFSHHSSSGPFESIVYPHSFPSTLIQATVFNPSGRYIAVGERGGPGTTKNFSLITRDQSGQYRETRLPDWGRPIFTADTAQGLFCVQEEGDEIRYWYSETTYPVVEPELIFKSKTTTQGAHVAYHLGFKNGLPVILSDYPNPQLLLHGKDNVYPELKSLGFAVDVLGKCDIAFFGNSLYSQWASDLTWQGVLLSDLSSGKDLRAVITVDDVCDADLRQNKGAYSRISTYSRDDKLRALNQAEQLLAIRNWVAVEEGTSGLGETLTYGDGMFELQAEMGLQYQHNHAVTLSGRDVELMNQLTAENPLLWLQSMAPRHDYAVTVDWIARQMAEAFFPHEFGEKSSALSDIRQAFAGGGLFGLGGSQENVDSAVLPIPEWRRLSRGDELVITGGDPSRENSISMARPGEVRGEVVNVTAAGVITGTLSLEPSGVWKHVVVVDQERAVDSEKKPSAYRMKIDYPYKNLRLPCFPDAIVNRDDIWIIVGKQRVKAEARLQQGYVVIDLPDGAEVVEYTDLKVIQRLRSFSWETHQYFTDQLARTQPELHYDLTSQGIQLPVVVIQIAERLRMACQTPLEFLQALEELVRQIGIYDFKNGEVMDERVKKRPQDLLQSWSNRAADIKSKHQQGWRERIFGGTHNQLLDKQVAGVCFDANVLLMGLLRHFGFVAGLNDVYRFDTQRKRSASFDKNTAHSSTFVLLPSSEPPGYIKLDLDGTYTTTYGKGKMPTLFQMFRERVTDGDVVVDEEELTPDEVALEDATDIEPELAETDLVTQVRHSFIGRPAPESHNSKARWELLNMVESNRLTALQARELQNMCWFLVMELQGGDPERALRSFEHEFREPYVGLSETQLIDKPAMEVIDYNQLVELMARVEPSLVQRMYEIVMRVIG